MLYTETATIRHQETSADGVSTFTISSPTLTVLKPDGTSITPDVTVSPGTASATQVLTATVPFDVAGNYRMKWSFDIGAQTLTRIEDYFTFWTDVPAMVRRRMQNTITQLPDSEIEAEFNTMQRMINDSYTTLGGYSNLSGLDQERFDEGVGILVALRMRQYKPPTSPVGFISQWKIQQNSLSFKQNEGRKPARNQEEIWLDEAYTALGRVSAIQAVYNTMKANFHFMTVSGPTRSANQFQTESLFSFVARLLTDDFNYGIGMEGVIL